jgi:hypothetical protein
MACTTQQIAKLAGHVWSGHGSATFALFDGAGTPGLLDRLYGTSGLEFECLYSGELEPDVAEVAPYIARLEAGTSFAAWALGGWGEHRGIFAQVPDEVGMPVLRRHFRKLNMVYGPEATPLLFRYYDPRVLKLFLSLCEPANVPELFGPVSRFVLEGDTPTDGAKLFAPGGEVVQELFSVS